MIRRTGEFLRAPKVPSTPPGVEWFCAPSYSRPRAPPAPARSQRKSCTTKSCPAGNDRANKPPATLAGDRGDDLADVLVSTAARIHPWPHQDGVRSGGDRLGGLPAPSL